MHTRFRFERSRPAKWFSLLLGLFLLLVVIGYQIWTLVSHQPPSPRNVFHQTTAGPNTNQPLSVENLSHLHVLWSYRFASDLAYDMTVANGVVYMDRLDALVAIQNAKRLWRYPVPGAGSGPPNVLSFFHISGNVVYLAANPITPSTESAIYALNAHTGQELWQYHSSTSIDSFTVDQTALYFSTFHEVDALENTTGKLLWSHRLSHDPLDGPSLPSLIAAQGNLYLALSTSPYHAQPSLIALDGRTGNVKWQIQERGASTFSLTQAVPFAVENGVIYRRNPAGIAAVDATTSQERWQVASYPPVSDAWGIQVSQNLLYLPGLPGQNDIQARDLSDGHLVWGSGPLKGNGIFLEPTISNGVIYVATTERFSPWSSQHPRYWVYAFNAHSGKLVRMLENGDDSFQPGSVKADQEHVYIVGSQLRSGSEYLPVPEPELDVLGV